jgi:WD40 repeat protein
MTRTRRSLIWLALFCDVVLLFVGWEIYRSGRRAQAEVFALRSIAALEQEDYKAALLWAVLSARTYQKNGQPLPEAQLVLSTQRILEYTYPVHSALFSNDGRSFMTAQSGQVWLWDSSGNLLRPLAGPGDTITYKAFSPNGLQILTVHAGRLAHLWDNAGILLTTLSEATDSQPPPLFSPDSSRILTFAYSDAYGAETRLWSLDGHLLADFGRGRAAFSPDSTYIAFVSGEMLFNVHIYDRNGILLHTVPENGGRAHSLLFSPDSSRFLVVGNETAWLRAKNGRLLSTLTFEDGATAVVFSPDSSRIFISTAGGTHRLWEGTGRILLDLPGITTYTGAAGFSPDSRHLLTISGDSKAYLWDRDGNLLNRLWGHHSVPIQFNRTGNRFLTISYEGDVGLWDGEGDHLRTLHKRADRAYSALFSPDGSRFVTAECSREVSGPAPKFWQTCEESTVRLWNNNGRLLSILQGHTGRINSLAFSPDSQRLLTTSEDGTARLWWAYSDDEMLDRAMERLRPLLTIEECLDYFSVWYCHE